MIKPEIIVEWATNLTNSTRNEGQNKVEPSDNYKENGSLDGDLSLNHFNFMLNALGLWSQFNKDCFEISNGSGQNITKDDHFSFVFAFDSSNINNYLIGYANKVGAAAASHNIISNSVLTFGTATADGTLPISGGSSSQIKCFSLNFKI